MHQTSVHFGAWILCGMQKYNGDSGYSTTVPLISTGTPPLLSKEKNLFKLALKVTGPGWESLPQNMTWENLQPTLWSPWIEKSKVSSNPEPQTESIQGFYPRWLLVDRDTCEANFRHLVSKGLHLTMPQTFLSEVSVWQLVRKFVPQSVQPRSQCM